MNHPEKKQEKSLHRVLKPRHLTMIALGGAIGTGLFIAVGGALSEAGPGSCIVAYLTIGIMVFFVMQGLGEMSTYMPVSGSFATYADRFVDPALGFALGWNYWFAWAVIVACELAASAMVMQYWFPQSSGIMWSAFFLAFLFILNALSARGYGEAEYFFAGIKVVTVVVFIIVGLLMIFGVIGGEPIGLRNLTVGDAPFVGGLLGIFNVALLAGFSFEGTELLGVAAGETDNPEVSVPKAAKTIFFRIMLFNVGSVVVTSLLIAYNDPNLLGASVSNIAVSPYVLAFSKVGIPAAAFIMNVVILTSILSVANSGLYASTRILYSMAAQKQAPAIFKKLNKRGVPMQALVLTSLIGFASFLTSIYGSGTVYLWLLNTSSLAGFIAWVGIALSHYRFRRAYLLQGYDLEDLQFKAKFFPFGPLFAIILCSLVIIGQNYSIFFDSAGIQWANVIVSYIGIPFFIVLFLGYKVIHRTKLIPLKACNLNRDHVNR